ncbi:MAG: protein kinase [Xenococcaceae cyanobacterium]
MSDFHPLWELLGEKEIDRQDHQYHLKKLIGVGGYGAVFEADQVVDDRLSRTVAIKLIPTSSESRDRDLQELKLATQLVESKYLVQCYTWGEWQYKKSSAGPIEFLYLVMELAENTLRKRLEQGSLSVDEVHHLLHCMTSALIDLHKQADPLVHRDLKPENVLWLRNTWKLADFGLIRPIDHSKSSLYTATLARGTPVYAPPEAYKGRISPKWDLWALGVILIEAMTGNLPFSGDTSQQIEAAVRGEPASGIDRLPAEFQAIASGCLQKNPRVRWTAEQVQQALLSPSNIETKVTEVIGFDLGHGDTAICKVLLDVEAGTIDLLDTFGYQKNITAMGTDATGNIYVGNQAMSLFTQDVTTLNTEIKPKADTLANHPENLLKDYMRAYYEELRSKGYIQGADNSFFVIGCPSGWNLNEREKYAQLLRIDEIPPNLLKIISESRAAFIHAGKLRESKKTEESKETQLTERDLLFSEVLVIDVGSSTTDFTVVKNKQEELKDFGANKLGASLIDKSLFALSRTKQGSQEDEIEAAFRQNPALEVCCVFACRCAKEIYFSQESFYEANPEKTVEEEDFAIDRKERIYFQPVVNYSSIKDALNMPQAELDGKGWSQAFKDKLWEVKNKLEQEGTTIDLLLLTGGASKMGFIRKACTDIFKIPEEVKLIIDSNPEYTIARGLAGAGKWDVLSKRFKQEVKDLIERNEVQEVVRNHIPKLIDLLVEGLSNKMTALVREYLKNWQEGKINTFVEVKAGLKSWSTSDEAKEYIQEISKGWLQDKTLLEDLDKKTQPICRKYRMGEDKLNLQTKIDPDVKGTFSLEEVLGIEAFTELITEVSETIFIVIFATGASVGMIAFIVGAWWTGIIASLVSVFVPQLLEQIQTSIEDYIKQNQKQLINWLNNEDFPKFLRGMVLSDQRIDEICESKKPDLSIDLKKKMQEEQFFETVVIKISDALQKALSERADRVAVLIE